MHETLFEITNGCMKEQMCVKCDRVREDCSAVRKLLESVPPEKIEVDLLPNFHVRVSARINPNEETYESCIENIKDLKDIAEKIRLTCLEYQLKEMRARA
ncbi:MAG: hypothetical protein LBG89_03295 [Rickettsiales bacterium]|jgi:hypothetical protein|nr:hypothetical protein [Rickettsiales bacterium]